jgi:hypothetical protein
MATSRFTGLPSIITSNRVVEAAELDHHCEYACLATLMVRDHDFLTDLDFH